MCTRGFFLAWSLREFIFSALGHIGQTVNARGFVYATCCAMHTLVAHQAKGRGFGIVYCRNVVERCVNMLKHWLAIATRYEKRATNYRAAVVIASLMI